METLEKKISGTNILARLIKRENEKILTINIKNISEHTCIDTTNIKIVKEYYEQFYPNKFDSLHKMNNYFKDKNHHIKLKEK